MELFDAYDASNRYVGTIHDDILLQPDGEQDGTVEKNGSTYSLFNAKGVKLGIVDTRSQPIALSSREVFKAYVHHSPLPFVVAILALITLFGPFGTDLFSLFAIHDPSLIMIRIYVLLSLVLTFIFSFHMAGWSKPFLLAALICGFMMAIWNQIKRQTLIFSFYDLITGILMLLFLTLAPSVIGVYLSRYLQMCTRRKYRLANPDPVSSDTGGTSSADH